MVTKKWRLAAVRVVLGALLMPSALRGASPAPLQSFEANGVAPRAVEETTSTSVQRDYAHPWKSLASALENNRAELLNENFTGTARQQWQEAIASQKKDGLSRKIIDHGHAVKVTFYSLDGSALEATDTADLEIEYRDGGKVLSTERVKARYLMLMTPAENSWKLRVLQELPQS